MTYQPLGVRCLSIHHYQSGICGKFSGGPKNNLLGSTTNQNPSTIYTDPARAKNTLITYSS